MQSEVISCRLPLGEPTHTTSLRLHYTNRKLSGWLMLQAGRAWVRDPDEVNFFNLLNPSGRTTPFTQPLTEMSTRSRKFCFWGVEYGLFVGLTNLPPSVSPLSRQCLILNISEPYRPPRPVTRIALLLLFERKLWKYSARTEQLDCTNNIDDRDGLPHECFQMFRNVFLVASKFQDNSENWEDQCLRAAVFYSFPLLVPFNTSLSAAAEPV
jgi:hypothetical protein